MDSALEGRPAGARDIAMRSRKDRLRVEGLGFWSKRSREG